MKKFTITIFPLLLVVLWTSCSNNLDEKVYSEILDETYQYQTDDFEANIAGAYNPLRSDNQMYYWYVEEQSGCCVVGPQNISIYNSDYPLIHYHTWNSTLGFLNNIWNGYFQGIVLCNYAIERIERDVFPDIAEQDKAEGIAELRVLSLVYFWCMCYCV